MKTLVVSVKVLIFLLSISTPSDGSNINKDARFDTTIPLPMASDVLTILINGTVHFLGNCTKELDASQVNYWLYTPTSSQDGTEITSDNLSGVESSKQIIFLLHGWGGYKNIYYMAVIKDAYLQRYKDVNIVEVDYGPYANSNYQSAYCNAPYVAKNVANLICNLKSKAQVNISSIHVVGHSMGGQISGLVGKDVQDICGEKIGRITGLDPAGPLYEGINKDSRLDKSDAVFVDVIHTNQGQYGYIGQLGHTDFYPNGGMIQPGCKSVFSNITFLSNLTIDSLISYPLSFVVCNHQRSTFLFAESINRNGFYSKSVAECFGVCVPDLLSPTNCYMGEDLRQPPVKDNQFTCSTKSLPPYGEGPIGDSENRRKNILN